MGRDSGYIGGRGQNKIILRFGLTEMGKWTINKDGQCSMISAAGRSSGGTNSNTSLRRVTAKVFPNIDQSNSQYALASAMSVLVSSLYI